MTEYHKIVTVWERDPATKHRTLLDGKWAEPEFAFLKDNEWVFTEKVDGTNIRVMWDGAQVRFGGKTDAAQLYVPLIERLQSLFYSGALARLFDGPTCLYGDGYGARIQKGGGNYLSDSVDFVLFDVLVGETWLERLNVEDVANKLECRVVPIIGRGSLLQGIDATRAGFDSTWGTFKAEGMVMRPATELRSRRGHRIITKIKTKDFK